METVKLILFAGAAVSLFTAGANESYYKEVYPPVDLTGDLSNHLFFALIQSFGSEFNGSGNIAGIKVALDKINNRSDILANHTLHYTLTDSKCQRTTALDALFSQFLSRDGISKVALIGAGCSVATEPTAEVSHYYNVTHISCSTASTELIDRSRFRRYFQLLQTMRDIAPIYFTLIKHYNWNYVSIITQNENLYTVAMDALKQQLTSSGIRYSEKLFETNESITGLREPVDPAARIFIVASYERHARVFLCEAYRRNIKYPSHLIILMGWYEGKWWLRESEGINDTCSPEDREKILPYALTVHHFNFQVPNDQNTTSGIRGFEYKEEANIKIAGPPAYNRNQIAPYCYDATWTLAYALDNVLKANANISIRYSNELFHRQMFDHINNSNFIGITGPVRFNTEGIRSTNERQVFQIRPDVSGTLQIVRIGEVTERTQDNYYFDVSFTDEMLWPDGTPRDGVARNTTVTIHPATTAIFFILASCGIIFTLFCLVFNCYFRSKTLIKLGSPKLNYLIGIGAIILYIDVYLHVIPTKTPLGVKVLCNLEPWLTAIGYSLCYGTIVAKMVRIHYIFNNPKPNSKNSMKDWKLAVGVLILVVIDLVILVTYTSIVGAKGFKVITILNEEDPTKSEEGFGIVQYNYFYACKSGPRDIFLGILYGYKGALQIIALVLAFSIRKVKVKGLNDALYIAAAIYVTSLLWAVIIICTYTLYEYLNVFVAVFSLGLLVGTTAIMGLVFIPKVVNLHKDPSGDSVFTPSGAHPSGNATVPMDTINGVIGGSNSDQVTEVISLRKKLAELEQELAQLKQNGDSTN